MFGVVTTRDGSEVVLVHDLDARPRTADQPPPNRTVAPDGLEADDDPCLWWRRGRAYLHLEHELRLAGLARIHRRTPMDGVRKAEGG